MHPEDLHSAISVGIFKLSNWYKNQEFLHFMSEVLYQYKCTEKDNLKMFLKNFVNHKGFWVQPFWVLCSERFLSTKILVFLYISITLFREK